MRAILIDDEQNNRENLLRMLAKHCPSVEILASCASVLEARQAVVEYRPDLLFLDIQLGDGTGFSLLESLPDLKLEIIFVTAYDNYAIKAIKVSALDYLLKPLDPLELIKAVEKAELIIQKKHENVRMINFLKNESVPDKQKKIAVSVSDKIEFIEISSIIRCVSESNYTTFCLKSGEKIIASRTLKEYDELLSPYNFLRVHQSHLINLEEIKSFVKLEGGYIRMKDGSSVPISRQRRSLVLDMLSQI